MVEVKPKVFLVHPLENKQYLNQMSYQSIHYFNETITFQPLVGAMGKSGDWPLLGLWMCVQNVFLSRYFNLGPKW